MWKRQRLALLLLPVFAYYPVVFVLALFYPHHAVALFVAPFMWIPAVILALADPFTYKEVFSGLVGGGMTLTAGIIAYVSVVIQLKYQEKIRISVENSKKAQELRSESHILVFLIKNIEKIQIDYEYIIDSIKIGDHPQNDVFFACLELEKFSLGNFNLVQGYNSIKISLLSIQYTRHQESITNMKNVYQQIKSHDLKSNYISIDNWVSSCKLLAKAQIDDCIKLVADMQNTHQKILQELLANKGQP